MATRCLLVLLPAALLGADTLTQGERDRAMSHLHATRKMFLDAVGPLTEAQYKYKPAPEVWSVAEIAEHIALSEDLIFGMTQKLLERPATPEKKSEVLGKDETVVKTIADRSRKAQAPEQIRPSGKYATREALVEAFKRSRDRSIGFVQTTHLDLRSHFATHPAAGLLDAYQWILLMSAHTDRHAQQMREVMASPGFPK